MVSLKIYRTGVGIMSIKPRLIIDALISRTYRKQKVYISSQDTSFYHECDDMLRHLYDEDFESTRTIIATLVELGFFSVNADGTFRLNNRLREFLLTAEE